MLQTCRQEIAATAEALDIQPDILLGPAHLREAVWHSPEHGPAWDTHQAAGVLRTTGARPWQVDITAPILADAHAERVAAD